MTQLEAMQNAQLFHHACRVPIALYRGLQCFLAQPEERMTASLLLSNVDPIRALDIQFQQLFLPQHIRSRWREEFIFLNAGDDLLVLVGPMTLREMDETRMRRLFRILRPMVQREGSLRRYLSGLPIVPGETLHYLGRLLQKLFVQPSEVATQKGNLDPAFESVTEELSSVVRGAMVFIDNNLTEKLTAQTIAWACRYGLCRST